MSNDVQGYFATQTFSLTLKDSDKVQLVAIGADQRGEFLPDIPTFKELGYDGVGNIEQDIDPTGDADPLANAIESRLFLERSGVAVPA